MIRWLVLLLCVPCLAWSQASREFDKDDANYLTVNSYPNGTLHPGTMACWASADTGSGQEISGTDTAGNVNYHRIRVGTPLTVGFGVGIAGDFQEAASTATITADVWFHHVGLAIAIDDRENYLNGVLDGTNAVSMNPNGLDTTSLGIHCRNSGCQDAFDGNTSHCAVWDIALSTAEITELASGMWTSWVHTDQMNGLWFGYESGNELDMSHNTATGTMVENGTVLATTSGPPVFFPIGGM